MEVSGINRNEEVIEMEGKVEVSVKILPFGRISYEIPGLERPMREEEPGVPRYIEPLTTNIDKAEICYEEGETYSTPKTTGGM